MYYLTRNFTQTGGFIAYEGTSSQEALDARDYHATAHKMEVKHGSRWRECEHNESEVSKFTSKRAYLRGDEPVQVRTWYKL